MDQQNLVPLTVLQAVSDKNVQSARKHIKKSKENSDLPALHIDT